MNIEDAQSKLDDIDNKGSAVTDWEAEFIDSMLKQTDKGIPPTDKQAEMINSIWKDMV